MKFLDSNVLAYAFYSNEHTQRCQEIIREGGLINTANLVEAYNILQFETTLERATAAIKELLKSNLKVIDLDINIVFEALKRTTKHQQLKFMDLIHYVTSLLHNCSEIISFDKDFDNLEIPRTT